MQYELQGVYNQSFIFYSAFRFKTSVECTSFSASDAQNSISIILTTFSFFLMFFQRLQQNFMLQLIFQKSFLTA